MLRCFSDRTLQFYCVTHCATFNETEYATMVKTKDKTYTMQEMADNVGVNKTSVYRFLKKENITPAMTKGNTNFYSATTMQRLKNHFKKGDTKAKTSKPSNDLLIETLQQQVKSLQEELSEEKSRNDKALSAKDTQIDELNSRLRESHQLQLGLQKKLEALPQPKEKAVYDAESSDRDVKGTSYGNAKEELKEAPKGFWRRLFGQ